MIGAVVKRPLPAIRCRDQRRLSGSFRLLGGGVRRNE